MSDQKRFEILYRAIEASLLRQYGAELKQAHRGQLVAVWLTLSAAVLAKRLMMVRRSV